MNSESGASLLMGGLGGVYLLAEPGELTVEVEKRDRNRGNVRTELRAILVGPDRRVLQEATIPDDGQPKGSGLGPPQRCRLSARVDRKGVHVLNITVSQDRYGLEAVWGFRTNCTKYLIETARGHKDDRHQEPIVLASPDRPANVCFLPRRGAFGLEVSEVFLPDRPAARPADRAKTFLVKGAASPQVFDARGALIAALQVDASGQSAHKFDANVHRDATPWRLHLPTAQATVSIDGVTRWESGDLQRDMACWTPDANSWFPFLENRWLLTPYSRTAYGQPGEQVQLALQVRNDALRERTIQLGIEFPEAAWPVRLSAERVVVAARQTTAVAVTCAAPETGQARVCHVRATPLDDSGFSTYSTLTVKAGESPATKPLAMPLVLKAYQHENGQLGYLPDYPVENQVYFDMRNRPFVRASDGVATWRDGHWATASFSSAVKSRMPAFEGNDFSLPCTKVAFDRDNDLYALATVGRTATLLHSTDGGRTFSAYVIPGREDRPRAFDIEEFSGQNVPDGPPPIVRFTRTAKDDKLIWRSLNDLELFAPRKVDGRLALGEPVLISDKCIGLAAHSGIPSSVVSRGAKVHVTWGEATDPKAPGPGVPTYVATYDRETRRLGTPALVGYGPPPNDVHNSPSITMDSQGYLHVQVGTHGRPFPYARSLRPNDAHAGWTEAALVGENLNQTYIGLVCGPDDTLHAAFRLWRFGVDPFPASHYATLAYQRKRPG